MRSRVERLCRGRHRGVWIGPGVVDSETRERAQAQGLRTALAARLSESRFEAFSRHAPAVLALYNRDGTTAFVSDHFARRTGIDPTAALQPNAWRGHLEASDGGD